ncbi:S8 family serine peptidase [Uliginosibacterium sp. H3]|uniref:S8 family serine peptidase n=1 Tax=Uliginosibacterium silvisoli TaxID=3114758 RepID=A0ABU6K3R9_9RHOO|nr:S8 family serine peptidase [Uliginosibacterium sp. H3]
MSYIATSIRSLRRHARLACLLTGLVFLLSACGGGGGGGSNTPSSPAATPAPATATYTLSGTITLPDTAAVDGDTNDEGQNGRSSNNSLGTSQSISTPVQLVGTVNVANSGPVGATYAAGDVNDYFKTPLTQGQVIEMSFVGGSATNDVDLYLIDDGSGSLVGSSTSSATSKCIQVGRTGTYYIRVQASAGSALYTLRIGAPGEATCAITSTSTEAIIADELVAKLSARGSVAAQTEVMQTTGLQTIEGGGRERAHLLRLSSDDSQRAKGLARLERWGKPGAKARDTSQSATQAFPGRFRRAQRAMETLEYAKRLMATGLYDYVEPNFQVQLLSTTSAPYTPTEPLYIAQRWSYQQINQPSAMDRILSLSLPGSTQRPIVAVIDSGIIDDHPDLQTQIYNGRSLVSVNMTGDGDSSSPNDPSTSSDTPDWHGTHVAGTIAALDNNGKFGAGVAPQALLMPLRVFAPGRNASSFDIVQAIRYAAGLSNRSGTVPPRKADVINMSIGAAGACAAQFSTEIANARAQNVVIVAAAGNHERGSAADVSSPANCAGVIAVGALDARQQQTYYSNSGVTLRVMAPGGDAYQSTTGTGYVDAIYSTIGSFNASITRVPSFGPLSGTSMASPHVAGVIALMRYVDANLTPADIDTLIANGQITDDLGATGRDDATGYGLINARKAVDQAAALVSGGGSPSGIVVASPASISFGSLASSATLELKLTAASSEVVTSITSSSPAVSVAASSVNATTKLGTYTVTADRTTLPLGSSYPYLTVTTNQRSFKVQLTIIKVAPGTSPTTNYGRMIVAISNANTGVRLGITNVYAANGKYAWSISGIPASDIRVIAGTNLNYNGYFCDLGEVCAIYPDAAFSIKVNADTSGLDFAVAPTGITASFSLPDPDAVATAPKTGGLPDTP